MINKQAIENAHRFFSPEHLAGQDFRVDETALLVVDIQRFFCDPGMGFKYASQKSVDAAKKIHSIVPAFRKAGVKIYPIRSILSAQFSDFARQGGESFYIFEPKDDEETRWKQKGSAFDDTQLYATLVKDGMKNLLVCGVYLGACVYATARHATEFQSSSKPVFNVAVLPDLSACMKTEHTAKYEMAKAEHMLTIAKVPLLSSPAVLKVLAP